MAWNFANWYLPLLEGCCHGVNVPVPYEDGMTFLESNERIITILNQLIDNNNEIPEIIKEEVKTELGAYLETDEGKQKVEDIVAAMDLPYVSKSGDTMTGKLTLNRNAYILKEHSNLISVDGEPVLNIKSESAPSQIQIMRLFSPDKIRIYSLATPDLDTEAANKKYVDDKVNALGNVLVFKGVKATVADLPLAINNNVGDVWYVEATKSAWAWVKDSVNPLGRWDEFGPVIDLEPYFKKADIVQTTGNATDKVMSQKAATDSFVDVTGDTITGNILFKKSNTGDKAWRMGINPDGTYSGFVLEPINNADKLLTIGRPGNDIVLRGVSNYPTQNNDAISLGYFNAHSGGGVNVVQTTGTSTTDVMSQKAATDSFVDVTGDSMSGTLTINTTNDDVKWVGLKILEDGADRYIDYGAYRFITHQQVGNKFVKYEFMKADSIIKLIFQNIPEDIKNIRINHTCVKELKDPVDPQDAATKNYVDTHFIADESSEAMPVEIAVDPTTRKLKGALMTAYNSPTGIGGVVSNGEKTFNDTIPVHIDSDGKQWVAPAIDIKSISFPKDAILKKILTNRRHIIATLEGNEGATDLWIESITKDDTGFNVKLNADVPVDTLLLNYILFD